MRSSPHSLNVSFTSRHGLSITVAVSSVQELSAIDLLLSGVFLERGA